MLAAAGVRAATYPSKPITLWVPWAAGGATDICLRLLADLAAPRLGQTIVVENRGGAGGTLAMPILQQAEPDGYTIAQIPQPVLRAPYTQKVLWDPVRDVTPIIQVSRRHLRRAGEGGEPVPPARGPVRLRRARARVS